MYFLFIFAILFSDILPSVKIVIGGCTDVIMSISTGDYFREDIPTLVINDGSSFSDALCSFLHSLITGSKVSKFSVSTLIKNFDCNAIERCRLA